MIKYELSHSKSEVLQSMELKIEDLISSIKKDGIDSANAQSEQIISEAQQKAEEIINEAKAEKEKIIQQTKTEVDVLRESAKTDILQAKRDAVLLFEEEIKKKFKKILEADIKKSVNGETLATLIKAALGEENPADYYAEVAEITDGLKAELANEINNGLEIKISPAVKTGFRLCAEDNSGYFDCSNEEITNMLEFFLSDIEI